MKRLIQFIGLLGLIIPKTLFGQSGQSFELALKAIYKNTVPIIHHDGVAKLSEAYLLDTRSSEEFSVSHLPGSTFVGYDDFKMSSVAEIPKSDTIVVYCSIGYRSERIGEKLLAAGYKNVFNLYGGIFDWKNNDRVVVDSKNEPTEKVHAYNKTWGLFLDKGEKVY
ncbi:MAG: rhodanese-related sulfurtransferase [Bacteroidia bacterium]|jgi:rhodanese-related sulfurtransferase